MLHFRLSNTHISGRDPTTKKSNNTLLSDRAGLYPNTYGSPLLLFKAMERPTGRRSSDINPDPESPQAAPVSGSIVGTAIWHLIHSLLTCMVAYGKFLFLLWALSFLTIVFCESPFLCLSCLLYLEYARSLRQPVYHSREPPNRSRKDQAASEPRAPRDTDFHW